MPIASLRLLLVENSPRDAARLLGLLQSIDRPRYEVVAATTRCEALLELSRQPYDVVLLNLDLPDSHGMEAFAQIHEGEFDAPVLILSPSPNNQEAAQAVRMGAQDYLPKDGVSADALSRAIVHARERHRLLADFQRTSLIDDLTGLYNRRGLMRVGPSLLQTADRMGLSSTILFMDLDGMKGINEQFGRRVGDEVLVGVSSLLKRAFRGGDLVARLGGDEFVVLAVGAAADQAVALASRVELMIKNWSWTNGPQQHLTVSIGSAGEIAGAPNSLDRLLESADASMCEQKQAKRSTRGGQSVPA
jgi:diguanylate cyclase (GGDEF)-like protein